MPMYDVVCGKTVEEQELPEARIAQHNRTTFCFCSPSCKARFERDPFRYIYPYMGSSRAFASVRRPVKEFVSVPAGLQPRTYA